MEERSAVWLLAALLLMEALISAEAQNSLKYFEIEGKLVLQPESFSGSIRSITWKFNDDIVGVLDEGQELVYAPAFKDRSSVNTATGVLEISNMMKKDSGVYTVAINNKIQSAGYDVKVIKQVPKPVIKVIPPTCSKELESCSLSCDGEITEAKPVTFYFKKDTGGWEKGEQNIKIINGVDTQAVEKFSCRMENPLGQKDSEPVDNPFYKDDPTGRIVGIVVGIIAAVCVAVGGGVLYQKKCSNKADTTTGPSTKEKGDQGAPLNDRSPDSNVGV